MKNNIFFDNLAININNLENTQKNKMIKINFNNLDYLDGEFCNNEDINYFLQEKTVQVYQLQANSSLELGKIFSEAFKKLAGNNHYNGLYEKWLLKIGFNKMTALRHRKRYELYIQVKNEHSKKLISILPIRILMDLINNDDKENILDLIEANPEFKTKDIKNLIVEKKSNFVKEKNVVNNIFFKEVEILKKIDIKKLDSNKVIQLKNELEKMLEDIKKILK